MNEAFEFAIYSVLIGAGATALVDLWTLALNRIFGVPLMNWGMVGRWFGHMPQGRLFHESIAQVTPIPNELALGWTAHYAIGIGFAGVLLAILGLDWARQPTLLPALCFGLVTVVAPFFLLQPGLGMGIAAAKAPQPMIARLRSLLSHTVMGLGFYLAALLLAVIGPL